MNEVRKVKLRGRYGLAARRTAIWVGLALIGLGVLTPAARLRAQDPQACTATSSINANRRAGPSTFFVVLGVLAPGRTVDVHGQIIGADNYTWWLLDDDSWVRSDVVEVQGDCESVPQVFASGTPSEEARQAFAHGMAQVQAGDYAGALASLELARTRFSQADMADREVLVLLPLGVVYQALGQAEQARAALDDALTLWRAAGDQDGEAVTLMALGDTLRAQDDPDGALDAYQQALDIQLARGSRGGQALALHAMGLTYFEQARYTEALDYFQRALPIWFEISSRESAARTLQAIGDAYAAQGKPAEAVSLYGQALSLWQSIGNKQHEAETLLGLSQAFSALGDAERAAAYDAQAQVLLAKATPESTATPSN